MHALIIFCGDCGDTNSIEVDQVSAFEMYQNDLKKKLDFTFNQFTTLTVGEIEMVTERNKSDIIIVIFSWRETQSIVQEFCRHISERHTTSKLVFLDYYAQTASPHFGVLPYVDLYIKRQMLKDRANYYRDFKGGYIFTDFLDRRFGYNIDGWYFGSYPDPNHLHKLVYGWNLGVNSKYRRLLKINQMLHIPWESRPYAINCRLGTKSNNRKQEWYQRYRRFALDLLQTVRTEVSCTNIDYISPKQYLQEMIRSKIVVSPFGWGEVCFRDYEAVCCGALLVKPSMSHLETSPNIFVEGETYVPIKWDLSNLVEKCEYYLAHPGEAKEIIQRGQDELLNYYEKDGFVNDTRRILARL